MWPRIYSQIAVRAINVSVRFHSNHGLYSLNSWFVSYDFYSNNIINDDYYRIIFDLANNNGL